MLQASFAVVRYPCLSWSLDEMCEIMNACVIMHNMIIEDERDTRKQLVGEVFDFQGPMAHPHPGVPTQYAEFLAIHREIRDGTMHKQLHDDLVHLSWPSKRLSRRLFDRSWFKLEFVFKLCISNLNLCCNIYYISSY